MIGVMNNTKWDELRNSMYSLRALAPMWRTKDRYTGNVSAWDTEWFYHLREGGYVTIEWLEIKITTPEQREAVLAALSNINVPGFDTLDGFHIVGWLHEGQFVDYIR